MKPKTNKKPTKKPAATKRKKVQTQIACEKDAPKPVVKKLVDEISRSHLCEGRNCGIGFVFAKKDGDKYTTVNGVSPCKDYLNDQVYSEATGKNCHFYGYSGKKLDIFVGGYGFIVMGVMPYKYGAKYADQDDETKWFNDHFLDIQKFINQAEDRLKINGRTTIEKIAENRYLATVPHFWCQYTYLISIWSLFARYALERSFDASKHTFESFTKELKGGDSSLMSIALKAMAVLESGKIPVQDWEVSTHWHNEGVSGFFGKYFASNK